MAETVLCDGRLDAEAASLSWFEISVAQLVEERDKQKTDERVSSPSSRTERGERTYSR